MGCDIHSFVEVKNTITGKFEKVADEFTLYEYEAKIEGKLKSDSPFYHRDYGVFGFLANVRNDSCSESVNSHPYLPSDVSKEVYFEYEQCDMVCPHTETTIYLKDLLSFDYEKRFIDKRDDNEGLHVLIKYKDFLPDLFFVHIEELKTLGQPKDVRVVCWFDN